MRRKNDTKIFELKHNFKLLPINSPLKRHRVQLAECNHFGLLDANDHAHGDAKLCHSIQKPLKPHSSCEF